jgi:two-component system, cell cycle response regulator DivK
MDDRLRHGTGRPVVDRRTASGARRTASRGGRRAADNAGRPLVLVVDDHVDSRELLSTVLLELGVSIAEAGTGKEALQRLAIAPAPDLILIDLSLPDCSGTDVVRALKLNPATRHIPVIALSASVMAPDKAAAAAAGCAAFIEKPALPDDVVRMVRRLLSGAGA